ncbi:MAG: permease-like cell division protein FtsX [Patescibacteria group bacterium]
MGFIRILKFAFQDIFRNFSLSFMTVLILILMLLSINTLIVVRIITQKSIDTVKDQIDVSVYFNAKAVEEEISEIRSYISSFPEVTSETFLTKEQVLENFKKLYADNEEIMLSLTELGENPLGPTLIVKTRDPRDYKKIISALDVPEYRGIIEAKTFDDTEIAIEKITNVTNQLEKFTYFLTALFAIISFVIIFNTIRVAIYTQRIEIGIKKLVGATNWYVKGPYIIEALVFSMLSIVLSFLIILFAVSFLDNYLNVIFSAQDLLTKYYYSNIMELVSFQFLVVFLLTALSSSFAMSKYLRK